MPADRRVDEHPDEQCRVVRPHRGTPDTWERISRRLALSEAHSSMSCQSGNKSLSRVCQVNSVKSDGSAVTLLPFAKSSIRRPSAVAQNALDTDAMWNSV